MIGPIASGLQSWEPLLRKPNRMCGPPPGRLRQCGRPMPPLSRPLQTRSEEQTSELQSLMRISYVVFCLKNKYMHRTNNCPTYTLGGLHVVKYFCEMR